jgi:sugar phosphate isomerase/epimerase
MSRFHLSRRGFMQGALSSGIAVGPLWHALAHAQETGLLKQVSGNPEPGPIGDFKISLAEWSLHKRLFGSGDPAKMNLDFPRMAKEEFGISAVEFVNQFFKDKARDDSYLAELKKRANDLGVTCVLIMIDGEGDLSSPNKSDRDKAVENHKKWVDAAKALGCHSIRVNTGEHYSATNTDDAAEGCGALASYGQSCGINVICENHGGPSSDPDALIALIKAVNCPCFGTLPDFGNFPRKDGKYTIDIYDAIARMMPYAKGVSAKSYSFLPNGLEETLDYPRILKIVTDSGYHGHVGIEFEGSAPEPQGILATRKLLETLRGGKYHGPAA